MYLYNTPTLQPGEWNLFFKRVQESTLILIPVHASNHFTYLELSRESIDTQQWAARYEDSLKNVATGEQCVDIYIHIYNVLLCMCFRLPFF